jgi:hypothetical protein
VTSWYCRLSVWARTLRYETATSRSLQLCPFHCQGLLSGFLSPQLAFQGRQHLASAAKLVLHKPACKLWGRQRGVAAAAASPRAQKPTDTLLVRGPGTSRNVLQRGTHALMAL